MNLVNAVKAAGVVGAGGAGFPTHIKVDTLAECFIINAVECEPLIETDKYLCRSFAEKIVGSAVTVASKLGAKRIVIAIKGKYEAEIDALRKAIEDLAADIEIFRMDTFYPAGDEQIIVQQVCKTTVPERGIPLDVGVVVNNVGTVLNIADALKGIPVTEKYLSVVGAVQENIVLKAPIGTPIVRCLEAAQVKIDDYALIIGGPMMGEIVKGDEIMSAYVTKTTGNIIILPKNHYLVRSQDIRVSRIRRRAKSACIQCRMCTDLCPRYTIGHRIRPHLIMRNLWREQWLDDDSEFEKLFGEAANCCECGACELYSCPMGLSPRQINGYLKRELGKKNINVEKNLKPISREDIDLYRIPTSRLISRLGLKQYDGKPLKEDFIQITPDTVHISMKQHIGIPAKPVKQTGERVEKGELLGRGAEQGLSANIHASVTGIITDSSDGFVEICTERSEHSENINRND